MATKLDKPVVRETRVKMHGRCIILTISPATPVDLKTGRLPQPERIELRIKGGSTSAVVPMTDLVRWASRGVL